MVMVTSSDKPRKQGYNIPLLLGNKIIYFDYSI